MYLRKHQDNLHADSYHGMMNHLNLQNVAIEGNSQVNVGHHVILPSIFSGGPRYMQQNYQDAMATVRKYGKPDLFITFTCNPG